MSESPVAIITGGAQGIGAAITIELLKENYKVCVADIQEKKAEEFVKEQQNAYGQDNIIVTFCDVTKEADYKRIFDLTLTTFQRVDVLINNAGIIREQDPKKVIEVNLMGPILGCLAAIKYMGKSKGGKGGIVINTASVAGFLPIADIPIYVASKHGVVGLTRSYGTKYHFDKDGIIFCALCPSFTETELVMKSKSNTVGSDDFSKRKDLMSTEYVAKGVLKLLKDKINGSTLVVNPVEYEYIGIQKLKNVKV
ncbi:15-hydroxyprostaglandin dehydrogenase [Trichonephila clavata]|uniref:15-hydroxyprostaglandin dehydrogenase [NAD(+)] n=1 Tax=Trichonephila clavata TaxID=2740835 RepID=A0A8X6HFU4_TRICU|nr:15-hydroxyprostaglandin dehydrogenase [Trichonephila clavata]